MSERERWRKIKRAPAGYQVSSLGRVRSAGGLLTPFPDKDGYLRVTISREQVQVSHLVLEAFDRPRPYGLEACHGRNGVTDNRSSQLRWDDRRGNARDKLRERKEERGVEGRVVSPPNSPVTAVTIDVLR